MKRNIINRMTRKPDEGYSRGMYRTHIQLDQYELNDRLKMTKKKEVSLFFVDGVVSDIVIFASNIRHHHRCNLIFLISV